MQPNKRTRHDENLGRLARIAGQVRGVERMVAEGAYCIDILRQIEAARAALRAVGDRILRKHIEQCLAAAIRGRSPRAARAMIDEVMGVVGAR